jgi:hypothetical protein
VVEVPSVPRFLAKISVHMCACNVYLVCGVWCVVCVVCGVLYVICVCEIYRL